jgi:protein-disulfide isomerase
MTSRIGRYAAAMTVLMLGACGGPQGKGSREARSPDLPARATDRDDTPGAPTGASERPAPDRQSRELDIALLGFDRGSADAPVRVVEMSDYGCGYCRKFHMETWPVLRKEFVESGKIEWKFLPFVTGMFKNSPAATTAAECALEQGPDGFEAMNHRLWEEQKAWKGSDAPAAVIRGWVEDLGLDRVRFDGCVRENRRAARIAAANSLSRQIGVRGTPTFFIMGYPPLQGALPTDAFRQVLGVIYQDATKGSGG